MNFNKKKLLATDLTRFIILSLNIMCWIWVIKSNFSIISGSCLILLTVASMASEIILSNKDKDNINKII